MVEGSCPGLAVVLQVRVGPAMPVAAAVPGRPEEPTSLRWTPETESSSQAAACKGLAVSALPGGRTM